MMQLLGETTVDQAGKEQVRFFRKVLRRFERTHRVLMDDLHCCGGLTIVQCHPLLEIAELGQTSLSDLSSRLKLDRSTLSRTVEGLVRQGLVDRRPDSRDRRFVVLSLTDEGRRICDDINERNDRFYAEILARLPDDKREETIALFDGLIRTLAEAVTP
jgi:DNA-binding MarR family transcriptional regulator